MIDLFQKSMGKHTGGNNAHRENKTQGIPRGLQSTWPTVVSDQTSIIT